MNGERKIGKTICSGGGVLLLQTVLCLSFICCSSPCSALTAYPQSKTKSLSYSLVFYCPQFSVPFLSLYFAPVIICPCLFFPRPPSLPLSNILSPFSAVLSLLFAFLLYYVSTVFSTLSLSLCSLHNNSSPSLLTKYYNSHSFPEQEREREEWSLWTGATVLWKRFAWSSRQQPRSCLPFG